MDPPNAREWENLSAPFLQFLFFYFLFYLFIYLSLFILLLYFYGGRGAENFQMIMSRYLSDSTFQDTKDDVIARHS